MKRDFVDPELLLERRKNPDQRFPDGSGSYHVDDFFWAISPPGILMDRILTQEPCTINTCLFKYLSVFCHLESLQCLR